MYYIEKEMRFEAAHRLVNGYEGKCANIHGHSWVVRVEVKSPSLDKFGFVKDFAELKPLRQWIDDELDHAMLISHTDESMHHFLSENSQKHVTLPCNPTSENLARVIAEKGIALGFDVSKVEILETCTSKAVYVVPQAQ